MSNSTAKDRDAAVKAIADHMLRGYCMLDDYCPTCGGVLLQDRNKKILCVCCPAMDGEENESTRSGEAAQAQAEPAKEELQPTNYASEQNQDQDQDQQMSSSYEKVRSCLISEMVDAAQELNLAISISERLSMLQLIQEIGKTIKSLDWMKNELAE